MAREKGTGSLQLEKSGRWTMRVGIKGKRYSRSTRTTDREKAEKFLERFLSPLGLGSRRLPLADAWLEYVRSPNRRELAPATLNSQRLVWMDFARWMEHHHLEIGNLAEVTREAIAEYLACIRVDVCASTYNGRICVLREIFHVLADKAGLVDDPWDGVRLHADDCHSRRELTLDELERLLKAATKAGNEWRRLFVVGIYTGLRLGDCCCLRWDSVNLERGVIQLIPTKTRKHAHGQPITIPIHSQLKAELSIPVEDSTRSTCSTLLSSVFVNPALADFYKNSKWRVSHGLELIFKAAHIETSIHIEGRRTRTPEATFHSLRHTFVSLAANAGVPLPVVASIVGHSSTAMTRHYYHENEEMLRQAVAAIPAVGERGMGNGEQEGRDSSWPSLVRVGPGRGVKLGVGSIERRLRQLEKLRRKSLISEEEYAASRNRILAEI